jgi:hypothetical protein
MGFQKRKSGSADDLARGGLANASGVGGNMNRTHQLVEFIGIAPPNAIVVKSQN